jgi:hypothetical protein
MMSVLHRLFEFVAREVRLAQACNSARLLRRTPHPGVDLLSEKNDGYLAPEPLCLTQHHDAAFGLQLQVEQAE